MVGYDMAVANIAIVTIAFFDTPERGTPILVEFVPFPNITNHASDYRILWDERKPNIQ
jgi:hypothetical protein